MKAIVCHEYGPPASLRLEDAPPPAFDPATDRDTVLIDVHAAGLNFPDVLIVQGKYQVKPPFPFSPGAEVSGVVRAVGADVARLSPGDRVMAMTNFGGFAEQVAVGADAVMTMPAGMDFVPAAGFVMTYGTTYHALVDRGRLGEGEWLLVTGAGGGVGTAAVELGTALGARVIAAAGSAEKLAAAKRYGAAHLIDYTTEDLVDRVREITGGAFADVIYDPVGGDVFDQCMRAVAWDARVLVVGFAAGRIPQLPTNRVLLKSCAVVGVFWGAFARKFPEQDRANFEALFRLFERGKLKPSITATYPLARAAEAIVDMAERRIVGKAVVTVR